MLLISPPASIKPYCNSDYQDNTYAAGYARDAAVQMQHAPPAENLGPIMISITNQGQLPGASIGHVAGDIEQVFSQPNYRGSHATRISGTVKMPCGSEWKNKLKQRTAINSRTLAEKAHQRVTGFVQCQVCAVQNREPAFRIKPMETHAGNTEDEYSNQSA